MDMRLQTAVSRFDQAEVELCRAFNRAADLRPIKLLFMTASRLGDGVFWYSLMGVLPLIFGSYGVKAALHMVITGVVALGLYKMLKEHAVRERPFITHGSVKCVFPPLDRYSFPSGHTLHAVSFMIVASHYFPALWVPLGCFALLVALSRIVLGLHYPTDVVAGAAIGLGIAKLSIAIANTLPPNLI